MGTSFNSLILQWSNTTITVDQNKDFNLPISYNNSDYIILGTPNTTSNDRYAGAMFVYYAKQLGGFTGRCVNKYNAGAQSNTVSLLIIGY